MHRIAACQAGSCPLWVKSGHSAVSERCPLYPQKRTFQGTVTMSALCQKQTKCTAVKRAPFDRPVREPEAEDTLVDN